MNKHTRLMSGLCQQLLFGSAGAVGGALLVTEERLVQVSMKASTGHLFASRYGVGKEVRLLVRVDRAHRATDAPHPVFRFESFADDQGAACELPGGDGDPTTIEGVVSTLHFSRHGVPNGVVLESGDVIHLRPRRMAAAPVCIGARIAATGTLRTTSLGTRLLDVRDAAGIDLA